MTQSNNRSNKTKVVSQRRQSKNVRNDAPADHIDNPPKMNVTRIEVGKAKITRSPNYVEKVGLGNLKVINAHGYTDVWSIRA